MAVWIVIFQYAAVAAVVCFFFYRNTIFNLINRVFQPIPATESASQENRPQSRKKAKGTPKSAVKQMTQGPFIMTRTGIEPEKPADDTAFAHEFSLAQRGTKLEKKPGSKNNRARTKKQGQVEETKVPDHESMKANRFSEHVRNKAPMEPATVSSDEITSGAIGMETDYQSYMADTLRVVPKEAVSPVPPEVEWTSIPTKSQKVQKKAERTEETKKQRQRQAQKEHIKELKDEADAKQRVLMEKQRRDARIARGEPAKNGEGYREASLPSKSVWSKTAQSTQNTEAQIALLDTIESHTSSTAGSVRANGKEAVISEGN